MYCLTYNNPYSEMQEFPEITQKILYNYHKGKICRLSRGCLDIVLVCSCCSSEEHRAATTPLQRTRSRHICLPFVFFIVLVLLWILKGDFCNRSLSVIRHYFQCVFLCCAFYFRRFNTYKARTSPFSSLSLSSVLKEKIKHQESPLCLEILFETESSQTFLTGLNLFVNDSQKGSITCVNTRVITVLKQFTLPHKQKMCKDLQVCQKSAH